MDDGLGGRAVRTMPSIDAPSFWQNVRKGRSDQCWPWMRYRTETGYGRFRAGSQQVRAHRAAFMLAYGYDPAPLIICHTCDNPPCCNPSHLFAGTPSDNALDRMRKGRANPPRGEASNRTPLTADQVIDMRRRFNPNVRGSIAAAAREFGLSKTGAKDILRRRTWAHI